MYVKKFRFSDECVNKLVELTDGAVSSELFEKILVQLEKETSKFYFTPSSEANLIRIFSSIYDRAAFFQEISKFPHHGEILIAISACSNYLTDIVVRNPEYLYQIFDQEYLSQKLGYDFFINEVDGIRRFKSFNSKLNFLRQFKKRLILKIGLADILGMNELLSITEQLSFLAKSINSKLFEICYQEILNKYNLEALDKKYCICSLGKLGGNELNYSSDVDLILFYDFNEIIKENNKEYHEILTEAALLFIKSSTEITDRGYIYRIDFRLRPDGKYSPLCKSMSDYAKYYETRGEDWERQMLIKMNFLCGNESLYNQFNKFIQPYVYPSSFSSSVKDKIKQMKLNIERQNVEKENVKTFTGGIRDIEFGVQALQLINGGKIKSLRAGNTLKAISLLTEQKLLKRNESKILSEAYVFYRRIEHFLQLMNDTQTHIITDNKELLNKLTVILKIRTVEEFREKLKRYRIQVRSIYETILKSEKNDIQNFFKEVPFKNNLKAGRNIAFLRNGTGLTDQKEFDARTIELFGTIESTLIEHLKKSPEPDKILDNLVKVIRSTKFPSIWYSEFISAKFFVNFLKLCCYSQKAIDLISTSSKAEEFFLSRKVFIRHPEDLNEYSTEEIILSLSVQFGLGLISEFHLSKVLSLYIKRKIKSVLQDYDFKYNYFIAGLGSFGSFNMNFASDVDLIIVVEDVRIDEVVLKDFQNFIAKIKEILKPFIVDFKLRPEGKNSPLVWGIKNYGEYLQKRARIWEFQALLKLHYVCGNENLFFEFQNLLVKRVELLNPKETLNDISSMFSTIQKQTIHSKDIGFNIKKNRGGLLTIDFILQAVCLSNHNIYKKYLGSNFQNLFSLRNAGIQHDDLITLRNNFYFLSRTGIAIQNIFNSSNLILPTDLERRSLIARYLKISSRDFENKITEIIKSNNLLFDKYVCK